MIPRAPSRAGSVRSHEGLRRRSERGDRAAAGAAAARGGARGDGHDALRGERGGAALRRARRRPWWTCSTPRPCASAMAEAQPEVVVHQLTALPSKLDLRKMEAQYETTNRAPHRGHAQPDRRARARPARAGWSPRASRSPTRREGDAVQDEDDPAFEDAPEPFGSRWRGARPGAPGAGAEGLEGVVLRYGFFYGPGTCYAQDGATAATVRKRQFPIDGQGDGEWSASSTSTTRPAPPWPPSRAGRRASTT